MADIDELSHLVGNDIDLGLFGENELASNMADLHGTVEETPLIEEQEFQEITEIDISADEVVEEEETRQGQEDKDEPTPNWRHRDPKAGACNDEIIGRLCKQK